MARVVAAVRDPEPFASMNITPLIDVLLVLLVMLILTIPIATHEVPVELPAPGTPQAPAEPHRIDILPSGTLAWDGAPIAAAALPARLAAFRRLPNGQLQVAAAATSRYDVFDRTLATIKRAGVTKLGFVDNDRYAAFDR
jgi:biopolymer transport protein ExbD